MARTAGFIRTRCVNALRAGALACVLLMLPLGVAAEQGERCVVDDAAREVCLAAPAQRIIALSPGATELMYAAGGGERMVAAVNYSDYPPDAATLPQLGSNRRVDMEALLALEPDLVLVWPTGNPPEQVALLERFGIPLYFTEPVSFEDVATSLERLARLAGTEDIGASAAQAFRDGIDALRQRYAEAAPVPVFYQVWDEPIMTVNQTHLIHQVIALCGGENVFATLPRRVPRIGVESVLVRNPEAIVAGGMGEENTDWLTDWRRYPSLTAVQRDNLFFVPPSRIQRPTPRLLQGGEILCEHLETARARR
ncbi:cobalamin-binding protein [Alcanivorax limicola]|uniref:cobalamin-binding protein n=1 Tax=Alcanivorax limicola TaxID=2874102 RepID=UPI001CBE4C16|nr:cobalamin-binding protein [Alcanivorax limicola]